MAQDDAQGVWLPLAEAAERSGYHKEALRARAKRGGFPVRRNNLGHMLVLMPYEMLNGTQVSAQLSNGHDAQAAQVSNAQPAQADHELVDELRTRIAALEGQLERERANYVKAVDRAATAEGRAQSYLESLQDLATRLDVAHAELALARRSWWRRLMGALVVTAALVPQSGSATEQRCDLNMGGKAGLTELQLRADPGP